MPYRQAFAFGWAVLERVFWWSLVILAPVLVGHIVISRLGLMAARVFVLETVVFSLVIALEVFVIFPLSIRGAVPGVYSDFRVSLAGRAHRGERLTYFDSLQVSLLAFAIHGGLSASLYYWLYLAERLGSFVFSLIQLPFLVLVIYPAVAAAIVRVPFSGFRILIVHNARPPFG